MTFFHGLGMFLLGLVSIIFASIIIYFILNKVLKDEEENK